MAGGAVVDDARSGPVGDPFSMGTAQPVAFLPEVALPAEEITVVEVDLLPFFILQEVLVVPMVAVDAGEAAALPAMIDRHGAVGEGLPVPGRNRFTVMAAAAGISFNIFLPGQDLEGSPLISLFGGDGFLGDRLDRIDSGVVVGCCRYADPIEYRPLGSCRYMGMQEGPADDKEK